MTMPPPAHSEMILHISDYSIRHGVEDHVAAKADVRYLYEADCASAILAQLLSFEVPKSWSSGFRILTLLQIETHTHERHLLPLFEFAIRVVDPRLARYGSNRD